MSVRSIILAVILSTALLVAAAGPVPAGPAERNAATPVGGVFRGSADGREYTLAIGQGGRWNLAAYWTWTWQDGSVACSIGPEDLGHMQAMRGIAKYYPGRSRLVVEGVWWCVLDDGGLDHYEWVRHRLTYDPVRDRLIWRPTPTSKLIMRRLCPTTFPTSAMWVATEGDDVLIGSSGDDTIYALGGNDVVCSGPGKDHVYGGSGHDLVAGGAQRDWLYGGGGADGLLGDDGWDEIWGHAGDDTLYGGRGSDILWGGTGWDYVYAGPGLGDVCHGDVEDC